MQRKDQPDKTEAALDKSLSTALSKPIARRTLLKGALVTAPLLFTGPTLARPRKKTAAISQFGPSTITEPYLVPSVPGVELRAILTVGDSIGGYRMVGIPDGLGAFQRDNNPLTLLMQPEWGGTAAKAA